jgi:opacity protein-like surface antigen
LLNFKEEIVMKKLSLIAALLTSFLCTNFCSSAFADTGPFIEGNLGYSGTGTANINSDAANWNTNDSDHFGWNVNAGVMFLGLGAEVGYTRYGNIKYNSDAGTPSPANLSSTHIALRATPSILGPIYLLGKIGYAQLNQGGFSTNEFSIDSKTANSLLWGVGVGVKFLPMLYAQLQYQQVQGQNNLPTTNITMLGLGFSF